MKRIIHTLVLALLLGYNWAQAQSILVSGTVTDSLNGNPVSNYTVQLDLYDSTNMILSTGTMLTDSLGQYNVAINTTNGPTGGWLDVFVYDCNGSIQSLHFPYMGGNAVFNGVDFQICAGPASCAAAFTASNAPGNNTISFNDLSSSSSGTVMSWAWDFGDGNTGTGLNFTHTYSSPGMYYVCLTIATTSGCTSTFCDWVNVGGSTSNCAASLAYVLLPSGAYGFVASASGTALPVSYFYDFGNGNSLTTNTDTLLYTYSNGGVYYACVTVSFSDSCVATGCTTVGNNLSCQADFFAIPDTTGQYSLLLVNNSTGTGLNYFWDFGDGGTSTLAYPQHTYAGVGTYYICLTVADSLNTCTSTFCDSITVTQKQLAAFTIQVVPPGQATGTTNPAQASLSAVSLYPLPAQDILSIDMSLARRSIVQLHLIDLNGRTVNTINVGNRPEGKQHLEINVRDVPAGLYTLRIDANGSVSRRIAVLH